MSYAEKKRRLKTLIDSNEKYKTMAIMKFNDIPPIDTTNQDKADDEIRYYAKKVSFYKDKLEDLEQQEAESIQLSEEDQHFNQ